MAQRGRPGTPERLASEESLVTAAAEKVRTLILRRELSPGQHIVENTIAQRFDVSQGTVRAALRLLVHEGLLEIKPRRGCFVKQFTSRDVSEIYTLRNALESLAARGAAENMSPTERQRLMKCMAAIKSAIAAGDLRSFIKLDFEFHRIIVAGSRHARLQAVYNGLATQTRFFMLNATEDLPPKFLDGMCALHQGLADAIVAGHAEQAVQLASSHNTGTGKALAELLAAREKAVISPAESGTDFRAEASPARSKTGMRLAAG
jgi:DNA-binding GntR family transcriptional regulator